MRNLNSTQAELQAAWQRLAQRWEETEALWNDPVRRRFEKEYWTPQGSSRLASFLDGARPI